MHSIIILIIASLLGSRSFAAGKYLVSDASLYSAAYDFGYDALLLEVFNLSHGMNASVIVDHPSGEYFIGKR